MAQQTNIQWCDSTVNPTGGCDGCELWNEKVKICYAGIMTRRFGGHTKGYPVTFDTITKFPGRMKEAARWSNLTGQCRRHKPWLNNCPRLIFISDMSDALSANIDFLYLKKEIIDTVYTSNHHYLWLTKRPQRMAQFSQWLSVPWPTNLWVGTSITTQASVSRIQELLKVGNQHTLRFISLEPQWEFVDLLPYMKNLDWIIQGGQSGQSEYDFRVEWIEDMIKLSKTFGVALFIKQFGSRVTYQNVPLILQDGHGGNWDEWPAWSKIRQIPQKAF